MNRIILSKQKVKSIMEKRNIKNQTELAKMLIITKNQLSVILSQKFTPIKSSVLELCRVLEVDIEDIPF